MKHLTKKLFSMLLVVLMLVGMLPMNLITASAAENTVTISFTGGSGTNGEYTFTDDSSGVSIAFTAGTHSTKPRLDSGCIRLYGTASATNHMTVSAPEGTTITKIEFTMNGSYTMGKVSASVGTLSGTTWTGSESSVVFTTTAQTRINAAVVTTFTDSGTTCEHTNTEAIGESKDATCTEAGITAGVKCTDCDKVITAQETIPATGHTFVDGNCTNANCTATASKYALVTDVATIGVGDKIIVVANTENFAMGVQSGEYCPQVAVTKGEDNTIEVASDNSSIQVLTLQEGTKDDTYAFYTGKGYLCAASSSNNYLKTEDALSDNSSWTIEIADGIATVKAQGTYTRNWLRYNSSSDRFSCYGSGQNDISIYSFVCDHTSNETIEAKESTCTEDGIETGTKCADCGKILEGGKILSATGHSFVNNVCTNCNTNPTGLSEAVLALQPGEYLLGAPFILTGEITEINNEYDSAEEYITVTIAVTGYEAVTIKCYHLKAGELYTSADTAGLQVNDTITVKGALMNYDGAVQFAHGCTFTNLESAHTHNYTEVVTAPTCTEKGYTTFTCTCGTSYTGNETEALGHSYGEWEEITKAGCTTEGEQQHICSVCGDIQTEAVAATGHNFVNGVCENCSEKEPEGYLLTNDISKITATDKVIITMTDENGNVFALANDNGTSSAPTAVKVTLEDGVVVTDAANILWNVVYDNGNLTIYPAGTTDTWLYCTSSNNGVRVGTNDNKIFTVDADSGYLKHTATSRYLGVYNSADWRCYSNTTGNTKNQTLGFYVWHGGYCAHENIKEIAEKEPTCTEAGNTAGWQCNDCGVFSEEYKVTEATGHSFENNVCNNCNMTPTDIYTAALALQSGEYLPGKPFILTGTITTIDTAYNSQYGNITVTIAVENYDVSITCFRLQAGDGYDDTDTATLSVGDRITVSGAIMKYGDGDTAQAQFGAGCSFTNWVPTHTHTYTQVVTAPTCTTEGYTTYTCTSTECDNYSYTDNYVDALGHNYVEMVCSTCGDKLEDLSGEYIIAAQRSDNTVWYMTNALGTASTQRYQAVDSGLSGVPAAVVGSTAIVFTLEIQDDLTYKIYTKGLDSDNYLGWDNGNSGILVSAGDAKALTVMESDDTPGAYNITFTDRILALNANKGNNFFAFYSSGQANDLYLIPVEQATAGTTWGVTLGDSIQVNFNMSIQATDEVTVSLNDGTPSIVNKTALEDGSFSFSIDLAAAQMNDSIEIFVNGVSTGKTYSVRKYAEYILNGANGFDDKAKDIVRNMLAYGGASQTYFDYNTDNLASNGIGDVTTLTPAENESMAIDGSVSGIKYYGVSLLHKDKIGMRFYFTGDITKLTVTVEGKDFVAGVTADGKSYVEVNGINPQELGNAVEVSVSDGTAAIKVSYSPLNYIYRMYEKNSGAKDLVVALYGYYMAALNYVEASAE